MQVQAWWNLVNDLDDDLFQKAIVTLCKEKEQWWPTDNVPAMIRERIKEIKSKERREEAMEVDKVKLIEWKKNASPPPKGFKLPALYANQVPQLKEKNVR